MTKVNVLMIAPTFNYAGGIESFIMNNIRNISADSFNFDILTHDARATDYVKEIRDLGGEVFDFPPFSLSNIKKISNDFEQLIQSKKYDIIHCHMANAAFLYLRTADKHRVPVRILHSHQNKAADTLSHTIRNIPLLYIGKKYKNYSMACSDVAGEFLFRNKKYDIVRNAIDYEKYSFNQLVRNEVRSNNGFQDKDFLIVHTGRLTAQKNQKFLIELFFDFHKTKNNSHLVLVGDGEDFESLVNLVKKLELDDFVHFLGSRNDIERILQAADLFVFPSIYEGLGISVLEAQASGLYTICSTGVPDDSDISQNIIHLNLEDSKTDWLDAMKKAPIINRNIEKLNLTPTYDIKENANVLRDLYINYIKISNNR